MSKENLEQFCRLVLHDPALQDELKKLTDRDEFMKKVCELSKIAKLEISREDVERQMRENRKLWNERWI